MIRAFDIICVAGCVVVLVLGPVRADDRVPQVVTDAMQSLQAKTEAPRWAPASLWKLSPEPARYYAADVDSSPSAYKVHLYVCDRESPIGKTDPACKAAKNSTFGDFGVTVYRSVTDARRTFENLAALDCAGVKRSRAPETIAIREDVSGHLWVDDMYQPMLRWRYRGWRFALCWIAGDLNGEETVGEARSLLKQLDQYPPPSSTGYMAVFVKGDDIDTQAAWLDHQSIVQSSSVDPLWGIRLASAMRRWR